MFAQNFLPALPDDKLRAEQTVLQPACIIQHRVLAVETNRTDLTFRMRQAFLKKADPSMQLLMDLMESIPNVSLCMKNTAGRIMHVNRYNAAISGWR